MARIIVVEDEADLRDDLVEYLDRCGFEVRGASRGAELDRLLDAGPADVIVLDINLPGMSGIDLLAELRRRPETAETPVLALSAAAMDREIRRGRDAGFRHYLTKPLDISAFLAALEDVLDGKLPEGS